MSETLDLGRQLDKFKQALARLQAEPENTKTYRRKCMALQRAIADTRLRIIEKSEQNAKGS